jgi:hypothetical protein
MNKPTTTAGQSSQEQCRVQRVASINFVPFRSTPAFQAVAFLARRQCWQEGRTLITDDMEGDRGDSYTTHIGTTLKRSALPSSRTAQPWPQWLSAISFALIDPRSIIVGSVKLQVGECSPCIEFSSEFKLALSVPGDLTETLAHCRN